MLSLNRVDVRFVHQGIVEILQDPIKAILTAAGSDKGDFVDQACEVHRFLG